MPKVLAVIMELLLAVVFLWLLSFLVTFLHEFGHALGYMLGAGGRRWHIRVGSGKVLLDTKVLTVKAFPFDGYFSPLEKKIDSHAKLIMVLAGGPVLSLLLVVGLLVLKTSGISIHPEIFGPESMDFLSNYALWMSIGMLIITARPGHYSSGENNGMATDGQKIINVIKKIKSGSEEEKE